MDMASRYSLLLALEVQGQQYVTDLETKMASLTQSAQDQAAKLANGTISAEAYGKELADLTRQMAATRQAIDAANEALESTVPLAQQSAAALNQIGKASGRQGDFGYGLLQASQALDDLQYGFKGILNNIPGLVMGFGGGAGLAGALQIATILFDKLLNQLGDLSSNADINKFGDTLRGMKERLEALEKKYKLSIDTTELDNARRKVAEAQAALDAFNAISGKTSLQSESGQLVSEGITEGGGRSAVVAAVSDIQKAQGTFYARSKGYEEYQAGRAKIKELDDMLKLGNLTPEQIDAYSSQRGALQDRGKELETLMGKEATEGVERLVGEAVDGKESSRRQLEEMYLGNTGAFRARGVNNRFGAALIAADPANIRGQRDSEQFVAKQQREARERKAAEAASAKQIADEEAMHDKDTQEVLKQNEEEREKIRLGEQALAERQKEKEAEQKREAEKQKREREREQERNRRIDQRDEKEMIEFQQKAAGYAQGFMMQGADPRSAQQMGERMVALMNNGASQQAALIAVTQNLDARMVEIQLQQQQQWQMIQRLQAQGQRGRQRQPTLLNTFPPGVR